MPSYQAGAPVNGISPFMVPTNTYQSFQVTPLLNRPILIEKVWAERTDGPISPINSIFIVEILKHCGLQFFLNPLSFSSMFTMKKDS
jgi:hypothetical protein